MTDTTKWYRHNGSIWDYTNPQNPRIVLHQEVYSKFPVRPKPRIDEPGAWGVVEASDERYSDVAWVHIGNYWVNGAGAFSEWADLIDPVLVRAGIEEHPSYVDKDGDRWDWMDSNPKNPNEPAGYFVADNGDGPGVLSFSLEYIEKNFGPLRKFNDG